MATILVVDDEERIRRILGIMLQSKGYSVLEAGNGREALQRIQDNGIDLVISDIRMDEMDGRELLTRIKKEDMACPVVFITAFASTESVIDALRLGAVDYLVKPFEEEKVYLAVERALGIGRLMNENRSLKQDLDRWNRPRDAVFESEQIKKVAAMAAKVAKKDATVLITGDSGTGKEVLARLIHQSSNRADKRFVAVNCAAIPETLLESELFGHEKGAFTGASKKKEGKFEYARQGTLFLDEIGELTHDAQVKLLRVIQEKCFQRVGGNREIDTDVRLVCATNRSLEKLVAGGSFRQDLYYRLTVFPIHIPSLHQRKADIVPLARYFIKRHSGDRKAAGELLTSGGISKLKSYPWPGNVRELSNVIERVMILKDGRTPVTSDDLGFIQALYPGSGDVKDVFTLPAAGIDFDELQKSLVKQALDATAWNQSAAARMLGLSRARFRTLFNQLDKE